MAFFLALPLAALSAISFARTSQKDVAAIANAGCHHRIISVSTGT